LRGTVYADHAGAGLHADCQAVEISRLLNSRVVSNPHSSSTTASELDGIALRVLAYFHADPKEFSLIWTSGATAALKLVGENFDWKKWPSFCYHSNCHNSAVGIREYAKVSGAAVCVLSNSSVDVIPCGRGLVCVPGQCNFSGRKVDVADVRRRMSPDAFLLVDGASLVSTCDVNVGEMGCDFFCVSFYKMFGLPSGLGALIVRSKRVEEAFAPKQYFGGGTVEASSASNTDYVVFRRQLAARYHDGTVPFLSILSLPVGFDTLARLGVGEQRIFDVAARVARSLLAARHWNGVPAFAVYGEWNKKDFFSDCTRQGAIVSFNVVGPDAQFVGYSKVEILAALEGIVLRTGCFCNPGACEEHLGLTHERVVQNAAAGKVCWDDKDVIGNVPTGCVRLSFGWCSTMEDADKIVDFLLGCFVAVKAEVQAPRKRECAMTVRQVLLYPVKSCAAMSVESWPLGERGLAFDREFVVLEDDTMAVMTQKRYPRLCLIRPLVDLEKRTMILTALGESFLVDLRDDSADSSSAKVFHVCGEGSGRVKLCSSAELCTWLHRVVGRACVLARLSEETHLTEQRKVGFANDAQLLVVSQESVDFLNSQYELSMDALRFRPNLVLGGGSGPHFEDDLQQIKIGDAHELTFVRACSRCEMVCVDQDTAEVGSQPLRALSSYRRRNGRVEFGSLFECKQPDGNAIRVGDVVSIVK
jgi:molybdenum cofactor sulfurtransferase